MGLGPTEIVIVGLILLVLFGPTLVAFFLGYSLGKKKAAEAAPAPPPATTPTAEAPEPGLEPPATAETPMPNVQEKQPDE